MTSALKTNSYNINAWGVTMCFMLVVAATLLPDFALADAAADNAAAATGTATLSATICRIIAALQGPVARGVAACGIIFLGFSLFMGKISWGTALSLGIGLGAIFGAKSLVSLMDTVNNNSTTCA